MPSLLEALEGKYGLGNDIVEQQEESLVSIFVPKLPPLVSVPELLVLNDCDIDCAGDAEDLKKKCRTVKELDLAQNKLADWGEVFQILSHMPRVEFVNLSKNLLYGPVAPPRTLCMSRLRSLVLNNTRLDWESVDSLLNYLPALQELHLSLNDYRNVLIDTIDEDMLASDFDDLQITTDEDDEKADGEGDGEGEGEGSGSGSGSSSSCTCGTSSNNSISNNNDMDQFADSCSSTSYRRSDSTSSMYKKTNGHGGVRRLHFTGNPVTDWAEICRLGRVFPNLESLVLAQCPLRAVEYVPRPSSCNSDKSGNTDDEDVDPPHEYFKSLTFLNLSNTNINTWDDVDRLAKFPSLKNLRVQNWPLWEKCDATEHERRQLLIARLPYIQTLNGGGVITAEEREDAERAFIRYYMDRPESDRPERYNELVPIHGKLDPLVNIDLRPEKRVKVTFTYGDTSEVRSVDVYRTVIDLKSRLERLAGIPVNKMRLFYVDQELRDLQGPEEMKYPHKQLYSYNIRSGDEIIIDQKK